MTDLLEAFKEAQQAMARNTLWYVATEIVPAESPPEEGADPEPAFYLMNHAGARTVLLHPDHLDTFLAQMRAAGLNPKEVDEREWLRRNEYMLREMINRRLPW